MTKTSKKRPVAPKAVKKKSASAPFAGPKAIGDLSANPNNPRKDWKDDAQRNKFLESLREFGDLSGIVYNTGTGQLVGGHKRVEEFRRDGSASLSISERLAKPDHTGTTAYGYCRLSDGTRFAYREVKWDQLKENAANLAANKWSAEWDTDLVNEMAESLKEGGFDLGLTGFDFSALSSAFDDAAGAVSLNKVKIVPPPTMGWVLVGIPLSRYHEISDTILALAEVEGTYVETTVNNSGFDNGVKS